MNRKVLDISRLVLAVLFCLCAIVTVLMFMGDRQARRAAKPMTFQVLFTGETLGELEPCNCAGPMVGGLAHRGGFVGEQPEPHVLVDVGCLGRGARDFEQVTIAAVLRAMAAMGYDAANVGEHELWLGRDDLEKMHDFGVPMVSANVTTLGGQAAVHPWRVVMQGSYNVLVTGLVDDGYAHVGPGLRVEPPVEAMGRLIAGLGQPYDALVVLADISPDQVQALCQRYPEIDLLLLRGRGQSQPAKLVNQTQVASIAGESRYIGQVRLTVEHGKPPRATSRAVLLDDHYPSDANVQSQSIDWYKSQVHDREFDLTRAGVGNPLIEPREPLGGRRYVGSQACQKCHEPEYQQWQASRHAHAMDSLKKRGYDFSPQCVVCHVTGLAVTSGFVSMARTPELGRVGCEACHGPGEALLEGHCRGKVQPGRSACVNCHQGKHDSDFDFERDWALINHSREP